MVVLVVGIFAFFVFRGNISMLYYYYYYYYNYYYYRRSLLWKCVGMHMCMDGWMLYGYLYLPTSLP